MFKAIRPNDSRKSISRLLLWGGLIFGLLLSVWLLWAFVVAPYFVKIICPGENECSSLGQVGDIFGGINALFAGLAFLGVLGSIVWSSEAAREERRLSLDKELVEQVAKSYQWAFDALKSNELAGGRRGLTFSRLAWLAAARHLMRAKKIVANLETNTYQLVQQEIEEYWRGQFYAMLNEGYGFETALELSAVSESHVRIAPISISVVLEFASWRETQADPLDGLEEKYALGIGQVRSMDCYERVEEYFRNTTQQ